MSGRLGDGPREQGQELLALGLIRLIKPHLEANAPSTNESGVESGR
jgi:hypothetical protein